jgi:DNA repair exonuclease SbcCD ATPase subunit
MKSIDNSIDVIDSRDIIERIEELESERETLAATVEDNESTLNELVEDKDSELDEVKKAKEELEDAKQALKDFDESEDGRELKTLQNVAEQCEGYGDWSYGEALIRESYFEDYARELAEDIGAINRDAQWPNNCIDWEQAARELKVDYTEIDFDGISYYMRA